VYVGAESADLIHRVKLDATGVSIDQTTPVGEMAVENEGPHGLNISPDGRYLYMTTAHGVPDGKMWKFEAGPDTLVARPILLGNFPATLDLTPDGLYAFVANFNLHGEHVPSTISVVYTPDMVEVDQIATCTMPHGLRVAPDGLFAYSMCMMDDQLVEIDTRTFEVSRRFTVSTGKEQELRGYMVAEGLTGPNGMTRAGAMAGGPGHTGMPMDHEMPGMSEPTCSPTWVQPAPDDRTLYVACNKSDEILVIDRATWTLSRKFPAGRAPYNLGITPDGRILVASLKGAGQVQFFDAATGESKAIVASTTTVTHGVAITPDSRYAFVSVEGKGAEPGKVDVFDLRTFQLVGSVGVGQQAGGIIFWKQEGM
jgi:YVTN family beta-propeller protein